MKTTLKNIVKKVAIIAILVYFISIFINQQSTLNSYAKEQVTLNDKIESAKEYNASLIETKQNINSPEFVEQVAREKLDMYLPNERVYIDISK